MAKVLVIGAHDDDPVIGVGGILIQQHKADDITFIVCTDGQRSHLAVLGISENPTPKEVAATRRSELRTSCRILREFLHSLTLQHWSYVNGTLQDNISTLEAEILSNLDDGPPDVVYVHALDAHPEHRAVHKATLSALQRIGFGGELYTYSIWTRDLAAGRNEVDASQIQELTGDSTRVDVRDQVHAKREALFAFTSQVQTWPYMNWQPQAKPILEAFFLNYHLRGEEIITRVHL